MIAGQQTAGLVAGDYVATPGNSNRVWRALDKLTLRAPDVFTEYYGNDVLALVAEASLDSGYQVTSQVNVVNPCGRAQESHRDYPLEFMSEEQGRAYLAGRARVVPGGHTEEVGLRVTASLASGGDRPTALVAFNDRVAVGLLDGLSRAGLAVPGHILVAGYDDSPLSRLAHIGLTTVSQDSQALSRHALAAVVERLDGTRTQHRQIVLPPRLVVRTSTGSPPPRHGGTRRPARGGPAGAGREDVSA